MMAESVTNAPADAVLTLLSSRLKTTSSSSSAWTATGGKLLGNTARSVRPACSARRRIISATAASAGAKSTGVSDRVAGGVPGAPGRATRRPCVQHAVGFTFYFVEIASAQCGFSVPSERTASTCSLILVSGVRSSWLWRWR